MALLNTNRAVNRRPATSDELIRQRIVRTIRMLALLKTGPIYNTQRLADELSVSRRTVYRDLRALRDAGIPILIDKWSEAYYVRAQREPGQIPLGHDHVVLLALAAHLSPLNCSPTYATKIRSAISALMDRLPQQARLEVGRLLSRTQGETYRLPHPVIEQLLSALQSQRRVRLLYESPRGVYRDIELTPCNLVASVHGWELTGRTSEADAPQTFAAANILRAEVVE